MIGHTPHHCLFLAWPSVALMSSAVLHTQPRVPTSLASLPSMPGPPALSQNIREQHRALTARLGASVSYITSQPLQAAAAGAGECASLARAQALGISNRGRAQKAWAFGQLSNGWVLWPLWPGQSTGIPDGFLALRF